MGKINENVTKEILRQLELINHGKKETLNEIKLLPTFFSTAGSGVSKVIVDNELENAREDRDYGYLFEKWAPYVCGTEGAVGVNSENSFGTYQPASCNWVKDKLTPVDICNSNIYYKDYRKRQTPDNKKYQVNGGGVVVRKESGFINNVYWCECKRNPDFLSYFPDATKRESGSYFDLVNAPTFKKTGGHYEQQWTDINGWFELKRCTATNKFEEFYDKNSHTIIPIISLALSLFGGIVLIVGSVLEFADALKYKEEGDDYMAGLSFIFACIGPLDFGISPIVRNYGKSFLKKGVVASKYTSEEVILLKFLKNTSYAMRLVKLGVAFKIVRQTMVYLFKANLFALFLFKIANLGIILTSAVAKMGLMIGGSFITWDYIAYKMDIENTMPIEALKLSEYKILQYIGDLGPYLQPFTTGSMSTIPEVEKIMTLAEENLELNKRIDEALTLNIEEKIKYDTKLKNTYFIEVEFIQYILKAAGFAKNSASFSASMLPAGIFIFRDAVNISKVQIYEYKAPPLMLSPKFIDSNPSASAGKLIKEWNPYNGDPINYYITGSVKGSKKYFVVVTDMKGKQKSLTLTTSFMDYYYTFGKNVDFTFKWGYYDEHTSSIIKEFQKSRGLKQTGVADTETLKKLQIVLLQQSDIPNYNNVDLSEEEINRIRRRTIEELERVRKKTEKAFESPEVIQKEFNRQRKQILSQTSQELKKNISDDENKEIVAGKMEELEKIFNKAASGTLTEEDLK
jgi:hypothetical protein